jgi:hypothetical protein
MLSSCHLVTILSSCRHHLIIMSSALSSLPSCHHVILSCNPLIILPSSSHRLIAVAAPRRLAPRCGLALTLRPRRRGPRCLAMRACKVFLIKKIAWKA